MADSKLRLQIVTALDNAGIKATREQIDSIEKSLNKVNNSGGVDKLEKQISRLPGPLGKLQNMFEGTSSIISKIGATATAVAGAFKVGWDIGSWVQEKVIVPLLGIKDPIEQLKKKNKELQKEHEKAIALAQTEVEKSDYAYNKQVSSINHEIQHLEKLNQAWVKTARAKNAYYNANDDIELQKLERDRFEWIMQLQNQGDLEGADQVDKLFDVYKAIYQGRAEVQKFDQETEILKKSLTSDFDQKRQSIVASIDAAEANIAMRKKQLEKVENENALKYKTLEDYNTAHLKAERRVEEAQNTYARLWDQLTAFDKSNTTSIELATREKQRAVLIDKLMLGIDQNARTYDQFVASNGNAMNFRFDEESIKLLNESSKQSYKDLENAVKIGIKEGIGEMMEVK